MAVGDTIYDSILYDSMSQHTRKSSSKDQGSKPTGTRHDAAYLQAKISYTKSHDPNNVSTV